MKGSSIIKGSSIVKDSSSKKAMMFLKIPAEGRVVSTLLLHGRKLNSKGQLDNERQLNNKGQLDCNGQLIKKSSDVFLKSRPKAGKLAYSFFMGESSIVKDN